MTQAHSEQGQSHSTDSSSLSSWLDRGRVITVISILFISGLVAMTAYVLHLESELVKSMAISDVSLYSTAIGEFRTVYTSEVVERARQEGVLVTHDYQEHRGAIPLPATLSMLLGKRIYGDSGSSVRLYSEYPFPWRATNSGPRDAFERQALTALQKDPRGAYMSFEENDGQIRLRYATADLMRASCVDCHNSHPDSPKRDWRLGDVRGVLSVTRPIEHGASAVRASLRLVVGLLAALAVLALIIMSWVAIRLRRAGLIAGRMASETARTNRELEKEIEVRERSEAESRKLEQQMRQAQKLEGLGVLAGGIAHDFNNLLLAVLGNTQLAKAELDQSTASHGHLKLIETAANRAKDLTQQLLAYAGRGGPLLKEAVDLTAMIKETSELLQTAVAQSATIQLELASDIPAIEGDRAQLQQVLMNLLTNAAESIDGDHGQIYVRTCLAELTANNISQEFFSAQLKPGPHIILEVEDNGKGMDHSTREKMFDPFFSTKVSGSGLGLAALQGIVRSHNGCLSVRSALGEGTTVRILFPSLDASAPAAAKSQPKTSTSIPQGTILVVDDQDFVRVTVSLLLESAGCTVLTAASGREAMALLKEQGKTISAILLDMRMPDMNGVETLQELRKIRSDVHIVLSSGNQAEGEIEKLVTSGSAGFLQKPYTEVQLLQKLHVAIAPKTDSGAGV